MIPEGELYSQQYWNELLLLLLGAAEEDVIRGVRALSGIRWWPPGVL